MLIVLDFLSHCKTDITTDAHRLSFNRVLAAFFEKIFFNELKPLKEDREIAKNVNVSQVNYLELIGFNGKYTRRPKVAEIVLNYLKIIKNRKNFFSKKSPQSLKCPFINQISIHAICPVIRHKLPTYFTTHI